MSGSGSICTRDDGNRLRDDNVGATPPRAALEPGQNFKLNEVPLALTRLGRRLELLEVASPGGPQLVPNNSK